MLSRLARGLPSSTLARRLSVQSGLFSVGMGVFVTGNAVFFTAIVGLTAAQVGVGMSLAGMLAFVLAVPMGRIADRFGPQRVWALAAAGETAVYACYPLTRSFEGFLLVVVLLGLLDSLANCGRSAYTIDALPRGERVRQLAFVRSVVNIGFTIGALLGGVALAIGNRSLIAAIPVLTAAMLGVNTMMILRLPRVVHESPTERKHVIAPGALTNKPYLAVAFLNGLIGVDYVLLNIVVPLWLVERTDAPHALLAWLMGTNTLLAVLLQVRAARGSESVAGAVRAARLAACAALVGCVLMVTTHWTHNWTTIVILWLGYVAVTGVELLQSAAGWGLSSELSEQRRRAEYQGGWKLGGAAMKMAGPAAFTWLVISWGPQGWLVVAAVPLLAAILLPRATRAAERRLRTIDEPSVSAPFPDSA